ncbi:MAG: hypothetical protein GYA24_20925 [Candidatus Lokiarchaeota archaeon]|nr:hypothetical protein [Candidatus Lokiarchaeota archaeon]
MTSDSITYALAVALACDPAFPRIILLKDVDGALRVHATRGGLPRRSRDARGTLVRRILVRSQRPRPALPTYPFDEFMFALVEEYQQPFFIVNWRRIDRVLELLENGRTPFCTAVMPG